MLSQRTARLRSSSYERSASEGLADLHVYVMPTEQWKNHVTSVLNQLITDSVSAGYVRVHPESVLSDLRQEINRQLGFESVPRDYVFLRCLGRNFTQVKSKQEHELKAKYFMPPHTYSPELYILDGSAAQRFSTSSTSSHQSFPGDFSSRAVLPPPSYPSIARLPISHDNNYRDRERADENLRLNQVEDELRRKRLQNLDDEENQRRRLREQEEENERTRRIIEELEMRRKEELEQRRKADEEEDLQRMRKLEEEEEEDRMRLRRLMEVESRRGGHLSDSPDTEFSRPKTPSPTPRQRTFEKQEPRETWKKRFFDEKKRTPPRDDKTKALKEELDSINRKIIDQLESMKDSGRKSVHGLPNGSVDKAYNMKLDAIRMEQEIDDLQSKLQSTKMQLTAEMRLRNQTEQELLQLKSELAQLRAKPQPRYEEEEEPIIKKTTFHVTYKEPAEPAPEPPKAPPPIAPNGALEEVFRAFASKNNGMEATGADMFKWCADAGIIGRTLNNHHIDISFHKVKPKGAKTITLKDIYPMIDELAVKYSEDTKLSYQGARRRLIDKLSNAPFKLHGATHFARAGGGQRLAENSKNKSAKSKEKPELIVESTGYVSNYKMAGKYDKLN